MIYAWGNLGYSYLGSGQLELSCSLGERGLAVAQQIGDRSIEYVISLDLGMAYLLAGRVSDAHTILQQAAMILAETGSAHQAMAQARLGAADLALGDEKGALAHTAAAVEMHLANPAGAWEFSPQEIWWWRYRALAASRPSDSTLPQEDDPAWKALDAARAEMLAGVNSLSDDGLRRNYFNKVSLNRQTIEAWVPEAGRRGLPLTPLGENLSRPGNVENQLKRMLDIGVRLNARSESRDLPDFIVEELVELTGADRAALYLADDGEQRHLAAEIVPPGYSGEGGVEEERRALLDQVALRRVPILRYEPEDALELQQTSILCLPLVTAGKLVGLIYAELPGMFGRFTWHDVEIVSVLTNQAAVALENAAWVDTLEGRVDERTAELQAANVDLAQRNAELAIINSVQQGLVAQMNIQGIYDLVGDQIREVFEGADVGIWVWDPEKAVMTFPYSYERGQRIDIEPIASQFDVGFGGHVMRTGQPLLINENVLEEAEKYGSYVLPGPETPKSMLFVPLIAGDQARGIIDMEDMEKEHAFSEADVRLLSTLASSMSVALENARLFDETQRLLKETEERNAELAIINSVQQGLVAQMNIQGIYDLVGDQIRQVFEGADVCIRVWDSEKTVMTFPYAYERGERIQIETITAPPLDTGFSGYVIRTGQPLLINENIIEEMEKYGSYVLPGTEMPKSIALCSLDCGGSGPGGVRFAGCGEGARLL